MEATCFETSRNRPLVLLGQGDAGASHEVSATLRALWFGLLSRHYVVDESFVSADSASLSLRRVQPVLAMSARDYHMSQIFDSIARGELQKAVAIERGLSVSSVAGVLRQVMSGMGLSCNFSRAPLGLPLLAHAVKRPDLVTLCVAGNEALHVVRFKRPDLVFRERLSPREFEVAHRYLEGQSYEEIGKSRRTSVRTVANQMSSTFRKLGVSGRFALLKKAVQSCERSALRLTENPVDRDSAPISSRVVRAHTGWTLPIDEQAFSALSRSATGRRNR